MEVGHDVMLASLSPKDDDGGQELTRVSAEDPNALRDAAAGADVVHAGPLDTAAYLAANVGLRPLVAVSWAYDLLLQRGPDAGSRVRRALSRAALLIADCDEVVEAARNYGTPDRVPFSRGVSTYVCSIQPLRRLSGRRPP